MAAHSDELMHVPVSQLPSPFKLWMPQVLRWVGAPVYPTEVNDTLTKLGRKSADSVIEGAVLDSADGCAATASSREKIARATVYSTKRQGWLRCQKHEQFQKESNWLFEHEKYWSYLEVLERGSRTQGTEATPEIQPFYGM
jgi:hypothetical protein